MTNFHDRDYSETVSIELKWREWNRIQELAWRGIKQKEDEDPPWPDEELEKDREIRKKLIMEISENSPGNGMDDWPDSMKEAYDETVLKMLAGMENDESE